MAEESFTENVCNNASDPSSSSKERSEKPSLFCGTDRVGTPESEPLNATNSTLDIPLQTFSKKVCCLFWYLDV
jgi:hypothetical protein